MTDELAARITAPFSEALQDSVLDSADIEEFLTSLARGTVEELSRQGHEVLCGVTLLRRRTKATVASSSEHAQRMDEVQYRFDDGPCLRAARTGQAQYVPDFRTETRFGGYVKAVSDQGLRSALGTPIPLDGEASAALDLYSGEPDAFDEDVRAAVEVLAREASKALRMAVRIAHLADTARHLRTAMHSRSTIQLAAGVIMGQNRCNHEVAMQILKAASSGRNMKLHDVAANVLASIGQEIPATHFDS
ncbi:GAF and ANTAR domain-containing protein [Arthrobacter sedimenti]|uniref:GAF and ANTAR domain-containing protein n=1 Tax=Arthrobacter sedimenti TaxID=2694931 RepID=UPI000B34B115|nr:GAF and ANTAR domain-containing protein [Arthrobacter sedimenti]OUM42838.1 response regulator receiver protein [Arthrobacter agilis]